MTTWRVPPGVTMAARSVSPRRIVNGRRLVVCQTNCATFAERTACPGFDEDLVARADPYLLDSIGASWGTSSARATNELPSKVRRFVRASPSEPRRAGTDPIVRTVAVAFGRRSLRQPAFGFVRPAGRQPLASRWQQGATPNIRGEPLTGWRRNETTLMGLQGSTVLVTGADGFIGSHLVERLVAEGADVRALCVYNSQGLNGWLDTVPTAVLDRVDVRLGDVRDVGQVRDLADDRELILHLAALIAIPYSYIAPRSFVETNVIGTLNVLEAARATGARVINTSTSEVYGTPDVIPIRETHPLKGQSPYAASKIAADKMCESYAMSFGTEVATLRPFNTFGPRQSLRAVIPTVLAQLLAGAERIHLGSLSPRRDFTFVSDTVDGFIRIACTALTPGEVVQLGTGESVSIGELVEMCQKVVGTDVEVTTDQERIRPPGSEIEVLLSDPSFAAERIGWSPQTTLEDGLRSTADWLASRELGLGTAVQYHR